MANTTSQNGYVSAAYDAGTNAGLFIHTSVGDRAHTWFPFMDGSNYITANSNGLAGNTIIRSDNGSVYTEHLRVQSNGNVGIGNTSPARRLDVMGAMTVNDNPIFLRGGPDGNHALTFATNFGGATLDGPALYGFSSGVLGTTTGGQRAVLFWNAGGNVGIGVTNPNARLEISNNFYFDGLTNHEIRVDGNTGRDLTIRASNQNGNDNRAGDIYLITGANTSGEEEADGGNLFINTGNGSNDDGRGGDVLINTGIGDGGARQGRVKINCSICNYALGLPNNTDFSKGRALANAWITYSSRRYKENIIAFEDALSIIGQLRPVEYDWKPENGGTHNISFIAEEVHPVMPHAVDMHESGSYAYGIDMDAFAPITVRAIQQQQEQIDELKAENTELKSQLQVQNERLEALERLMGERVER